MIERIQKVQSLLLSNTHSTGSFGFNESRLIRLVSISHSRLCYDPMAPRQPGARRDTYLMSSKVARARLTVEQISFFELFLLQNLTNAQEEGFRNVSREGVSVNCLISLRFDPVFNFQPNAGF